MNQNTYCPRYGSRINVMRVKCIFKFTHGMDKIKSNPVCRFLVIYRNWKRFDREGL